MEYAFTYLACQSCTAKIHCEKCAAELQERFLKEDGVDAIAFDIPNKKLSVQARLDEMDLLDLLEEAGIFAD